MSKSRQSAALPTISLPPDWMRISPCLPELVMIPASQFVMGDDFGSRDARPAHDLVLEDFQCSRFPITALEYAVFVIATRAPTPGLWPHPLRWLEHSGLPAARVTWRGAILYCDWLSKQTGRVVRLPTEAEWEKAATWDAEHEAKRLYPWGNEFDPACCNTTESLIDNLTPVDMYRIIGDSPYGVSDMFGNVAEWTLSRFMPYPYEKRGHDLNMMGYRAARGGSYQSEGKWVTALHRQYFSPEENRYPIGFRIVVETP